tara:strand:+ start:741 stop:917 length:177 start_codon:yes stop_codon:yes gene_type:complete
MGGLISCTTEKNYPIKLISKPFSTALKPLGVDNIIANNYMLNVPVRLMHAVEKHWVVM